MDIQKEAYEDGKAVGAARQFNDLRDKNLLKGEAELPASTNKSSFQFPELEEVLNELDFDSMEHHAGECEDYVRQAYDIIVGNKKR